jgi:hypothetical protein
LLNQPTHQAVAASAWARLCQGPRWAISSALYKPMIVSARALSTVSCGPYGGDRPGFGEPAGVADRQVGLPRSLW